MCYTNDQKSCSGVRITLWNNFCAGDKISFVLGADLNANRAKYGSSFILQDFLKMRLTVLTALSAIPFALG